MKTLLYSFLLLFTLACSGNAEKKDKSQTDTQLAKEQFFACPMKCEGDKTYSEAGKCPICQMQLQEVAQAETDTTIQIH